MSPPGGIARVAHGRRQPARASLRLACAAPASSPAPRPSAARRPRASASGVTRASGMAQPGRRRISMVPVSRFPAHRISAAGFKHSAAGFHAGGPGAGPVSSPRARQQRRRRLARPGRHPVQPVGLGLDAPRERTSRPSLRKGLGAGPERRPVAARSLRSSRPVAPSAGTGSRKKAQRESIATPSGRAAGGRPGWRRGRIPPPQDEAAPCRRPLPPPPREGVPAAEPCQGRVVAARQRHRPAATACT